MKNFAKAHVNEFDLTDPTFVSNRISVDIEYTDGSSKITFKGNINPECDSEFNINNVEVSFPYNNETLFMGAHVDNHVVDIEDYIEHLAECSSHDIINYYIQPIGFESLLSLNAPIGDFKYADEDDRVYISAYGCFGRNVKITSAMKKKTKVVDHLTFDTPEFYIGTHLSLKVDDEYFLEHEFSTLSVLQLIMNLR